MGEQERERRKNELLSKKHWKAVQMAEEGRSLHNRTETLRNSCRTLKAHNETMKQFKPLESLLRT